MATSSSLLIWHNYSFCMIGQSFTTPQEINKKAWETVLTHCMYVGFKQLHTIECYRISVRPVKTWLFQLLKVCGRYYLWFYDHFQFYHFVPWSLNRYIRSLRLFLRIKRFDYENINWAHFNFFYRNRAVSAWLNVPVWFN